jgi:hypothetical protein
MVSPGVQVSVNPGGGEYVGCSGGECMDVEAVEQGFGCGVVQHASGAYVATAGTVDISCLCVVHARSVVV